MFCVKPVGAETGLFWEEKFNAMADTALAHLVTRISEVFCHIG